MQATWSCSLGWPVRGVWGRSAEGSSVNCVRASHDKTLLALGDDSNLVRLLSYPSERSNAPCVAFGGHSSHVAAVAFSAGDEYVVSVGGSDGAVFVWRVDPA